jgi:hypothetical protein
MLPKEIFLSHSDKDRRFAAALVRTLQRHGLPTWYSRKNIVGAQQWHDEIGAALGRCDWFMLILSGNSVQSKWVKHELMFALNHNQYNSRIVPLLYQDCDYEALSWTLSGFQMVNFRSGFAVGIRDLLRIWGVSYRSK